MKRLKRDLELERPARESESTKEAEVTMSVYATDYSGGMSLGLGGSLGLGALREPPLSPPVAGRSVPMEPLMSIESSGFGLGGSAPTPGPQPVEPLIAGTAASIAFEPQTPTQPQTQTQTEQVSQKHETAQTSLPFVDLRAFTIDRTAARLIPEQIAHLHTVLPIGFEQGLPLVAIAEASQPVMESVRLALGCDARFAVASKTDLIASIAAAYTEPAAGPTLGLAPVTPAQPFETEPVTQPEPAVEPVATLQAEPVVEPVALHVEPVVEPVALHVEPATQPFTVPEPVVEPPRLEVVETQPEVVSFNGHGAVVEAAPAVEVEVAAAETRTGLFRVFVRLTSGEGIEIGSFDTLDSAKDRATELVREIADAQTWPFVRGRYLRPDAIVSVDIVEETTW